MQELLIEGFEIITNSDTTEGRGYPVTVGYAANRRTADYMAKGKGVMGSAARVEPVHKFIKVYETPAEYEEDKLQDEKIRALKRLSDREREVLGLTGKDIETLLKKM